LTQSFTLIWHSEPVNPAGQVHVKLPGVLVHWPPFWQGLVAHSFTSVWQFAPENPELHTQPPTALHEPRPLHVVADWQNVHVGYP